MVVSPQLAINIVIDPLHVSKVLNIQFTCMGVKRVESQIDMEYKERTIPLKKVGLTDTYILGSIL